MRPRQSDENETRFHNERGVYSPAAGVSRGNESEFQFQLFFTEKSVSFRRTDLDDFAHKTTRNSSQGEKLKLESVPFEVTAFMAGEAVASQSYSRSAAYRRRALSTPSLNRCPSPK